MSEAKGADSVAPIQYTVAVPVFCEAESLEELCDRIFNVFKGMGKEKAFRILFVDDGSTDNSRDVLRQLAKTEPYVKYIGFKKNQGKSMALMAAFYRANADFIITMDSDLQDNPEDIPNLINELNRGYDIVCGWRKDRNDSFIRKMGSRLFNFTVAKVSGLKIHDFNCGFKIYKKKVVEKINVFGQFHRFIPVLAHIEGFKITEVAVENSKRKYGSSRYPVLRFQGLFDLFSILFTSGFGFSPLHFFGTIGLVLMIPCACILAYLIGTHIFSLFGLAPNLVSRPLLTLSTFGLLIGFNLLMTGFVCDFILHHSIRQNLQGTIEQQIDEAN